MLVVPIEQVRRGLTSATLFLGWERTFLISTSAPSGAMCWALVPL
jgi:hypothetical protein